MNYAEYGNQNKEIMIFLHGGGLSWWNYREAAQMLSADYHVILPILDGHAGSSDDFSAIEENAKRILSFIDEELGGSVLLIGGLSLGAQILVEMLSQRQKICQYALIESASVIPSVWTCSLIRPAFGCCYGLIKCRWFARLQFQSFRMKQELFEDYYRDTCGISKSNLISFLQANAMYSLKPSFQESDAKGFIFAGEKENPKMKKSAKMLQKAWRGSTLRILPKWHHGEFSINHAQDYVNCVRRIIQS